MHSLTPSTSPTTADSNNARPEKEKEQNNEPKGRWRGMRKKNQISFDGHFFCLAFLFVCTHHRSASLAITLHDWYLGIYSDYITYKNRRNSSNFKYEIRIIFSLFSPSLSRTRFIFVDIFMMVNGQRASASIRDSTIRILRLVATEECGHCSVICSWLRIEHVVLRCPFLHWHCSFLRSYTVPICFFSSSSSSTEKKKLK